MTHPQMNFARPHGSSNCRITTRYSLCNFSDAFFSTLHEVGHGLYEQGLDPQLYGTPAGQRAKIVHMVFGRAVRSR